MVYREQGWDASWLVGGFDEAGHFCFSLWCRVGRCWVESAFLVWGFNLMEYSGWVYDVPWKWADLEKVLEGRPSYVLSFCLLQ